MPQTLEPCPDCGTMVPERVLCAREDCGATFRPRRDAIYCTPRCARIVAQRNYRARKAGQR